MGARNWCSVHNDNGSLVYSIQVEKEKGVGLTVGLVVTSCLLGLALQVLDQIFIERTASAMNDLIGIQRQRVKISLFMDNALDYDNGMVFSLKSTDFDQD